MATSNSKDSDIFATALRLLTGRDRSEAELTAKLKQLGFSASAIDGCLEKCREYNYLNDERYATERARALMRSGKGVGRKVLLDLRRRGIDDATAEQALEKIGQEFETDQLLRQQLERKFPGFDYQAANEKQRRRVVSYFQRRGFGLGEIFQVIKKVPK
ncbi:regulatory protein [Malonomonas rubra DSM 5091]|uniref:Regulatory protein RecX n=1 Tax=Malonomonas rubra DSM 5091 TaxID=1122189 RepID=A0A1M6LQY4_MALRU|nr:regulatory protein RecX [Malonomonas rubra]SHJ73607.1 regulatory protein [Malonomonas rubra DSM 5091]